MTNLTARKSIVILGGGVSGLTTALVVARKQRYNILVFSKWFPDDEGPADYTSLWAGAHYMPASAKGTPAAKWAEDTYHYLHDLATNVPEAGVDMQAAYLWHRQKDFDSGAKDWAKEHRSERPWFADHVPEFRNLSADELPPGYETGSTFKTPCINVPVYLKYLIQELGKLGVSFRKGTINHVHDAFHALGGNAQADLVVNCLGLGSAKLGGVADSQVYPARGQICLVRNPCRGVICTSGTDDGPEETFYVQPRLNGETVIGGCYQRNNWNAKVDHELAYRILRRAVNLCPELTDSKGIGALDVVRHGVGLRPVREGGPRVEREEIEGVKLVHNYGHGGDGYECSYGCALEVERLVTQSFSDTGGR